MRDTYACIVRRCTPACIYAERCTPKTRLADPPPLLSSLRYILIPVLLSRSCFLRQKNWLTCLLMQQRKGKPSESVPSVELPRRNRKGGARGREDARERLKYEAIKKQRGCGILNTDTRENLDRFRCIRNFARSMKIEEEFLYSFAKGRTFRCNVDSFSLAGDSLKAVFPWKSLAPPRHVSIINVP